MAFAPKKPMDKLGIMNAMGNAADKKAKGIFPGAPPDADGDNDGDEPMPTKGGKKPMKGKQVAAMKEKGK